jgi:hypothetical protein
VRLRIAALLASVSLTALSAHAQNATWSATPSSNDWNTGANWNSGMVPTNTARFGPSTTRSIAINTDTSINTMRFNAAAPAYTFAVGGGTFTIKNGIVNNSSFLPNFTVDIPGRLTLRSSATIGSLADGTSGGGRVRIGGASTTLFIAGSTATTFSGRFGGPAHLS